MRPRSCRPMALLLLVLHLGACTTWRPSTVSPRQLIEEEQPSSVRITEPDGTKWVLTGPTIQNDTIVGLSAWNSDRLRVGLEEVEAVEVRRYSGSRTFALVGAAVVGLVVLIFYESLPECGPGGNFGPCR